MGQNEPIRRSTQGAEIPDKLYFRIGDVAKLCGVPAYVLRFWETEFPQLKPNKGGTGQRLYRRRDVEMALRIKKLLYDEGYTIPGARQLLKVEPRGGGAAAAAPQLALAIDNTAEAVATPAAGGTKDARRLEKMKADLEELLAILSRPVVDLAAAMPAVVQTIRAPRQAKVHAFSAPQAARPGLFDLYPELNLEPRRED